MTPSDLYKAALRKLGVLPAGETPDAADLTIAAEAFEQICIDLGVNKGYIVDGTGRYLTTILAMEMADDFQVDEQRVQRLIAQYPNARRRVIAQVHGGYDTDTVTEAEYL